MKQRLQGMAIGVLATVLLLGTVTALANTQTVTRQITYGIGVILNGQTVDFDEESRPFVMDGRTFLPLRTLSELLELPIDFDPATNMAIVGMPPAGPPAPPVATQPSVDPPITVPTQDNEQTSSNSDSQYPQLDGLWLNVRNRSGMELDADARDMSITFSGNNFSAVSYFHAVANPMGTAGNLQNIGAPIHGSFSGLFPWQGRAYNDGLGRRPVTRGSIQVLLSGENVWQITTTGTFSLQHLHGQMFRITFNFADGTTLQEDFFYNDEGARSVLQLHPLAFVRY